MKRILIICQSLILLNLVDSLKVTIKDRKLYKVTPIAVDQITQLKRWKPNSEVILWSGIGDIGDAVEFLAVPEAMEVFKNETLSKLDLFPEIVFPSVEILMKTTQTADIQPFPISHPFSCNTTKIDSEIKHQQSPVLFASPSNSIALAEQVQKIPGTNLYTGVWYTIKMKRFSQGFVTWTDATNDHLAHFIQVDLNPSNLVHYKADEKWYEDIQWKFGNTEDPSWYTWDNRVLSKTKNAITTWSYKEVGSGYHIIASTKPEDVGFLSAGGKWRVHALWKPVSTQHGNFYKIVNQNFPQGTLTWTEKKYGDFSHYIQVDTNPENVQHYQAGGKWFDDSLFSFNSADVEISTDVYEFKFLEMPSSVLKEHTKSDAQSAVTKSTFLNPSSVTLTQEIEETFSKTSTFSYGFEESLKVFAKVTASFSVPLIASGSVEAGFEATVGANQQFTRSSTKTYSVKQSVQVPPHSSVVVSAFSEWIKDLEIPFNAKMIIRGTTSILSGEFIENYLKSRGEQYTVLESGSDFLSVNVKGKFKGTFGYRGIVSVENINRRRGGDSDNDIDDDRCNCNKSIYA